MPILDSELGVTHTLYCKPHKARSFVLPEKRTPLMCYYEPFQVRDLLQEEMALFVKKDIPCPTYVDTRASTLGWGDPRLPTVYGLIGRGLEPSILREFIMAMGSSSAVKCFQWHILWAKNKEVGSIPLFGPFKFILLFLYFLDVGENMFAVQSS